MRLFVAPVNPFAALRLVAVLLLAVVLPAARAVTDPGPTISGLDRTVLGPLQPLVITGANFTVVSSVKFAGVSAASFTVNSTTSIVALAPASGWSSGVISVTTANGTASSTATVTFATPSLGLPPGNATVTAGGSVSFSVANQVFGTGPVSYQWQKNGVALSNLAGSVSGANAATLTLYNVSAADAASSPGYTVVVTDTVGNVTSSSGTLTVNSLTTGDAFAGRLILTGANTSATGSSVGATKEGSEPNHAGNSGGASVWATWTAPSSGTVTVDTIGSNFNTLLGVYTGSSVSALTTVASDDDSGPSNTSKLTFSATAGTVYQIAVDGSGGATGNVRLNINYAYSFFAFAGSGTSGHTDATGTSARFKQPTGVVLDSAGNLYVADMDDHVVRKVTPAGVVTTLAGLAGDFSPSQDGTGTGARIPQPAGITIDPAGNLYVVELGNGAPGKLRKITPAGVVTTLASGFNQPWSVALDSAGNAYVTDSNDSTIKKVTPAGVVSVFAGISGSFGDADGPLGTNSLGGPVAIAVDASGNFFVATGSQTIRKITPAGVVSTVAGSPAAYGSADGVGTAARFDGPYGLAFDAAGNLYIAERNVGSIAGRTIRRMTPAGVVTTLGGSPGLSGSVNGIGSTARFREPAGLAVDSSGGIYIADIVDHKIRKGLPAIPPSIQTQPVAATAAVGQSVTFAVTAANAAGATYAWTKNGSAISGATSSSLSFPSVALSDLGSYQVTVTAALGSVTSNAVALTVTVPIPSPIAIFTGQGELKSPRHLTTDGTDWYITGTHQNSSNGVFKLPFAGGVAHVLYGGLVSPLAITTLGSDLYWIDPNAGSITDTKILKAPKASGTVTSIYTGASVGEPLVDGSGLATDGTVLYAADEYAGKVFKLNADGTGFTQFAAGARYSSSFSSERINLIAHDSGVLYLADAGRSGANSPEAKVLSIPVAGTAFTTLASGAPLVSPSGIAFTGGKVYVADPGASNTIWAIPAAGGTPVAFWSGAPFVNLAGLAVYNGDLYAADFTGEAIYRFAQTAATAPAITTAPVAQNVANGGTATFSVVATGIPAVTYQWSRNGTAIAGATGATLTLTNVQSAQVGSYTVTVTNGVSSVTSTAVALTGPVSEPTFVTQPAPYASATAGGSLTLSVTATGSSLTYQWRKFGQAIAGATNASVTLSGLTPFDAGLYDVVVTTSSVPFASNASRVTVNPTSNPGSVLTPSTGFAPRVEHSYSYLNRMTRTSDGKIYVSGYFTSIFNALRPRFARLNSDGSLDTGFSPPPVTSYGDVSSGSVKTAYRLSDNRVLIAGGFQTVGGFERENVARLNSDGSIDATFTSSFLFDGGYVNAIAVQPDNKILLAGSFKGRNLVRLNADGSEDTSFVVAGFDGELNALVLQTDGKIVVGGDFSNYGTTNAVRIARLTSTGALDTAYNAAISLGASSTIYSMALQPDGKILAAGRFTSFAGSSQARLVRLLDSGAIDPSFVIGTGFNRQVSQLALQADGTLYAAGDFDSFNGATVGGLVRLLASGAVDPAFSTGSGADSGFNDGIDGVAFLSSGSVLVLSNDSSRYNSASTNLTSPLTRLGSTGTLDTGFNPTLRSQGVVYAIAPAPAGKWYIGGDFAYVNGAAACNVARLNADGTLDTAFAIPGDGFSSHVYALAVQPDGKVVVGGRFSYFDVTAVNGLVRLTTTGARDTAFDLAFNFGDHVYALALQADGRILVAGRNSSYYYYNTYGLARIKADGTYDSSFTQPGSGLNGDVNAIMIAPDGDIYAGGAFSTLDGVSARRIVRFNADGSRDTGFVVGTGFDSEVKALALQSDGKLLAGGSFSSYKGDATGSLARLDSTGARDTAFAATDFGYGSVSAVAVQADGKILAAGDFQFYGSSPSYDIAHLARLTSAGAIDTAFRVPGLVGDPTVIQPTGTSGVLLGGEVLAFPARAATGIALLESAPVPTITTSPANQIAAIGGSATFSVVAGGLNLTYQWSKDGLAIAGATQSSFTISSAQITDAAAYAVTVSNIFGSATSTAAQLTGSGAAPTLTTQPASVAVSAGDTATLAVVGTSATAFQWRKLGVPIASATSATLSLPAVTLGSAGLYDVLVGNGLSVTRSTAARLTVNPAGSIQNTLKPDFTFAGLFESLDSYGLPTRIFAQPDGSYYVTGNFTSVDGAMHIGIARFSAAGVLDATFATEVSGGLVNAMARQTDGKLILAGDFHRVNGLERNHLARLNPDGSVDTTFLMGDGTYESLYAVAVQSDGKILIGGNISSYNGVTSGNRLARLNADGTLDLTFRSNLGTGFSSDVVGLAVHTDGKIYAVGAFTSFNGSSTANHLVVLNSDGTRATLAGLTSASFNSESAVYAVLVQPDGKILLGGDFTTYNSNAVKRLVRLNADGSYDGTFATGVGAKDAVTRIVRTSDGQFYIGGVFDSFGPYTVRVALLSSAGAYVRGFNFDGIPSGIALGASDALLVVGDYQNASTPDIVGSTTVSRSRFARFDSAGAMSASQVFRWGYAEGTVKTVVPAPGGKWLVGGYFARAAGVAVANLARLNADGTFDNTFSTAQSPLYNDVNAIAVQGDGKILVGGAFAHYGTYDSYSYAARLIRLNADGTRDASFMIGDGFDDDVTALAVQADGKIVVAGRFSTYRGAAVSARIVRLNADGSLDATFVAGTGFDNTVNALALQADGKILVGGRFTRYNSGSSNASRLVRLNANGSLEKAFDVNGTVKVIVTQGNGDFLVGGGFTAIGSDVRYAVARFNSAGVLDATFNVGDLFTTIEGQYTIDCIAVQGDGKLLVAGDFGELGDVSGTQELARLTSTGALDPTFTPFIYVQPLALALRADGGVIVAGGSIDFNTTYRNGLLAVTGLSGAVAPAITTQPTAQAAVVGGSATFSVVATGTPTPTYQWYREGNVVVGATNASYSVSSASQANAGQYTVVVTNTAGSVTSTPVSFDVVTRNLITFYAGANVAFGGSIVSSFTVEGTQSKTVLLVGVGGARANSGNATGALADPRLTLTDASGTQLALNNDWTTAGNFTSIVTAGTQVGATPGLTATGEGAKDAAILATLAPGTYHVKLDGADAGGGAALLQIYDADTDNRPRLVMFTLRAKIGSGSQVATAGFTIAGTLSKTVLIRALGDALGYSVGVLGDPKIVLYRGATLIDANNDTPGYGANPPLAFSQVGARATSSSLDSTLVQTLAPGSYTVQVTPSDPSASGTVLFELFEADAQRSATIAPAITYLASDQAVVAGDSGIFGVVAVAKPSPTFQWRKGGTPIVGATNTIYQTTASVSTAGSYDVVVTSGANVVTSPARTLSLLPEYHSADTNHDKRISLLELTRVIQLFIYSNGATRTGEYHTQAGTEDGFTFGPGAITSYHSADSNHDGRIDAFELSRVIELYSFVNSTVRTGEYHAAAGTEDGFTPGPIIVRFE